jgi:hypothetical protein
MSFTVFTSMAASMSPTTQRFKHSPNRRRKSMLIEWSRNKKEIVEALAVNECDRRLLSFMDDNVRERAESVSNDRSLRSEQAGSVG